MCQEQQTLQTGSLKSSGYLSRRWHTWGLGSDFFYNDSQTPLEAALGIQGTRCTRDHQNNLLPLFVEYLTSVQEELMFTVNVTGSRIMEEANFSVCM